MARTLADETQGVQVKLWYPLTVHAIPERLRDFSCIDAVQVDTTFAFTFTLLESNVYINVLWLLWQGVAADHIHMVESLKQLLAAVWKQITMWKDAEKREIAAQVTVDPSVLECLDKAYVFIVDRLKWSSQ